METVAAALLGGGFLLGKGGCNGRDARLDGPISDYLFYIDSMRRKAEMSVPDRLYRGEALRLSVIPYGEDDIDGADTDGDGVPDKPPEGVKPQTITLLGNAQREFRETAARAKQNRYFVRVRAGAEHHPRYNYSRSGVLPYPVWRHGNGTIYIDDLSFLSFVAPRDIDVQPGPPQIGRTRLDEYPIHFPETSEERAAQDIAEGRETDLLETQTGPEAVLNRSRRTITRTLDETRKAVTSTIEERSEADSD